ncbi:AAA family ATPase, partial [Corynebacterium sp. 4HC-13]|uniref:AAA family ATPase n=1 Tax=Corynebacterium anserum TaxID=2684406 RepID=UPI00163993CC
ARAMRAVVSSDYRASVVVAPAGAGKTSSLKAAQQAWEIAGKTVVGLAPTGKAADVMVGEAVAHESFTIARALFHTGEMTSTQLADHL